MNEEILTLSPPDNINYTYPQIRSLTKDNIEDIRLMSEIKGRLKEKLSEDIYNEITSYVDFKELKSNSFIFNLFLQQMLPNDKKLLTFNSLDVILTKNEEFFKNKRMILPDIIFNSEKQNGEHSSYITNKDLFEDFSSKIRNAGLKYSKDKPLMFSGIDVEIKPIKSDYKKEDMFLKFTDDTKINYLDSNGLKILEDYKEKNGLLHLVLAGSRVYTSFYSHKNNNFSNTSYDIFIIENPGHLNSIAHIESFVKKLKDIFD